MMLWAAAAFLWPLAAQEGGKVCGACHIEHVNEWRTHKHSAKNVVCEVCHGASRAHRNALGATAPDRVAAPDEVPELCGSCHAAQRKAYEPSKHGKLVLARSKTRAANCATCHGVHSLRDGVQMKRQCDRCHAALPAACQRTVQAVAGKLVCSSCHDPHTLAHK